MKNKIAKSMLIGLVALAVVAVVMASTFIWHQPTTPQCIA